MGLMQAFRAFFKALRSPKETEQFLIGYSASSISDSNLSHLRLLSQLQQSGRLIDFFKEDLSSLTDAQIGAVARKIHQECGKVLEEVITIRPAVSQKEGDSITLAAGYDPHLFKIVGKVKGNGPYTGTLIHPGWKAHKRSLPKMSGETSDILCPAEIEVG